MACITLLTDFGLQDEYVGVLKGVIHTIDPAAAVIDITHGIDARDVLSAAFTLKAAYRYYPPGTIHLAIVDPGVGSDREIIAMPLEGHILLAPNNGLLWPLIHDADAPEIYQVENTTLFRRPVSRTFHGRDIFAPAAAHLSRGGSIRNLGRRLPFQRVRKLDGGIARIVDQRTVEGVIVSRDRFGNLITNIHRSDLDRLGTGQPAVRLGGRRIDHWVATYADGPEATPVALIGSRDCLEIAVKNGSAAELLRASQGAQITVRAGLAKV